MVTVFLDPGAFCLDFSFVGFPLAEVLDFVVLMRGAIFGSAILPFSVLVFETFLFMIFVAILDCALLSCQVTVGPVYVVPHDCSLLKPVEWAALWVRG